MEAKVTPKAQQFTTLEKRAETTKRQSAFAGSVRSPANRQLTRWLRIQRRLQGLTMREVGERLFIPHSYISKIEHCERRLDIVEFVRYCQALGVDPHQALDMLLQTTD